jgi:hypothetical protein
MLRTQVPYRAIRIFEAEMDGGGGGAFDAATVENVAMSGKPLPEF